jgi:cellobiose phosphorylase
MGDHGAYAYLTGSSTWLMLTLATQVFGVRGEAGNLCIEPKLTLRQFDEKGRAAITCQFRNEKIRVTYSNSDFREWNEYKIATIRINGEKIITGLAVDKKKAVIDYQIFKSNCGKNVNAIDVLLS